MITRIPFGDWSGDGHKEYKDVWVTVPEWDSIPKAQAKIKQKSSLNGGFCSLKMQKYTKNARKTQKNAKKLARIK